MAEYVPSPREWVRNQVELYERSGGTDGTTLRDTGLPVIVVTHTGNKTGAIRKTPLMRVKDGANYVLVGSMGGAPTHPVWVYNLRTNPAVEIRDHTMAQAMRVREVEDEAERARLWALAVAAYPIRVALSDTLQSGSGLVFRLASVKASPLLTGMKPPVSTEIMVVALLQRAQRQHGLCPCEAPPLPFALHPVLDHGTTRRLHDTGPNGQAHRQVLVVFHPAPVVVEERDDLLECLPHRLPERPLRQDLSQSTDDISHPASENLGQLGLHPAFSGPRAFPEQGVGRAPEVADDMHDVQDTRHALPRLEELGRQAPQAEGTIEQDNQRFAVLGILGARRRP